jgi:ribose transport system substrate-binding protein
MKKKMSVLLVALMLCLIPALNVYAGSQKESAKKDGKGYVIGFSNFSIGNSFRVQMEAEFIGAADKLKDQGIISNYIMTNSNGDVAGQINDVRDLITKGVDAILITAASPTALAPVCNEAVDAGIVVISFNELVNSTKIHCIVDQDDYEFGRIGAQWLADELGGRGDVICLNGMAGANIDQVRISAYEDVFKKYPGIKVVGAVQANWDYATAKNAMQSLLAAHPKIDGIYSQGGAMTQAAIDAFVEAGRPLVPMTGESNNGFLKAWKKYKSTGFTSIAPSSPTYVSSWALEAAIKALNGEKIEPHIQVEIVAITADTLDKYIREDLPDSYWCINNLSNAQIEKIFK